MRPLPLTLRTGAREVAAHVTPWLQDHRGVRCRLPLIRL